MTDRLPVQPFYITGLPRSRTAWLAVALSDYRLSACLHEPLARVTAYDRSTISNLLEAQHTKFAGMSDSGLPVVAPDLPDILPGPVLVVWRNPDEVIDSLVRYMGGKRETHAGGIALLHARLAEFASRHSVMIVDFDDLAREDVMRQVWSHLLPGTTYQRRRIAELQRLRIDPVPSTLLDGVTDFAQTKVQEAIDV